PRYAPFAARAPWLLNARDRVPGLAALSEALAGFSARRSLPRWRRDWFRDAPSPSLPRKRGRAERVARSGPSPACGGGVGGGQEVVLFVDTFHRYFEPETIDAALGVLGAAGYRVHLATPADGKRPLCCGRTFLAIGKVDEARREAERVLAAVAPHVAR